MKVIIAIFSFFGLFLYIAVPNDWKLPIRRGFLLITAPFLLIYGIGVNNFAKTMLKNRNYNFNHFRDTKRQC